MRRLLTTTLVILPIALGGVGVTASTSATASSDIQDLRLRATVTDFSTVPDRGSEAQQPGDRWFFIAQLTQNSRQVGLSPHKCTAVTADYSICEAVANLPGGQVTLEGAFGGSNVLPRIVVAITGGTGKYRDAAGQVTITLNADGSQDWYVDFANN
jgi:hypothetical protein